MALIIIIIIITIISDQARPGQLPALPALSHFAALSAQASHDPRGQSSNITATRATRATSQRSCFESLDHENPEPPATAMGFMVFMVQNRPGAWHFSCGRCEILELNSSRHVARAPRLKKPEERVDMSQPGVPVGVDILQRTIARGVTCRVVFCTVGRRITLWSGVDWLWSASSCLSCPMVRLAFGGFIQNIQ